MMTPTNKTNVVPDEDSEVATDKMIDFLRRSVPEIWLSVFDKLDEKDNPAFSRASPEWHDLVESKRTQFVFQELAPSLLETLPESVLLQNRNLCQYWTETGDHHAQSHPSHLRLMFEKSGTDDKWSQVPTFFIKLCTAEKVNRFMNEMETHQGNPFPGRFISLLYYFRGPTRRRECQRYWQSVTPLLQKFGNQVHFASFALSNSEKLGIEFDHTLRACLLLLPNLKGLYIRGGSGASENELKEYYQPGVLPQLEHLETLTLQKVDVELTEALLNFCCVPAKLKRLLVHNKNFPDRQLQNFINLEALSDHLFIEELESIPNLPLRNLEFSIDTDFRQLFNALGAFHETLTQLIVHAYLEALDHAEMSSFKINLPNLKRLEIREYAGVLDSFLQFKALSELKIGVYHVYDDQKEYELVQVGGFEGRMMESNIWSLMPSLQKLSLKSGGITYERDSQGA